ncbi:MAG: DegT/DnrJ/EryC1/StrS family aminotransferase [Armatimonadota bacterium]
MTNETLALFGGPQAKTAQPQAIQRYGAEELAQLQEALAQNTLFYAQGSKVKTLCARFAEMHGVKHCIPTSSCTAALHTAVAGLNLEPGDEIITGPITDMGTVIGILWCQLIPVFADLGLDTHTLDPESVRARITPRTKAIIPVHLSGAPSDMRAIQAIAKEHGLAIIEDCAQSYLAEYDGRLVGTFGDLACFSINEYKHISCGDAGLVLTDNDDLAERCQLLTDKGYLRSGSTRNRNMAFLALNYRMTELQGAVALAQLGKLPEIVAYYRALHDRLHAGLQDIEGLHLPRDVDGGRTSAWFYMLRVDEEVLGVTRDWMLQALQAEGASVGPYIAEPIYRTGVFVDRATFGTSGLPFTLPGVEIGDRYDEGACPNAEKILKTCINLSFSRRNTLQEMDETAAAFRKVVGYCLRQGGVAIR